MKRYDVNGTQVNSLRRSSKDVSKVAFRAVLYSVAFVITWDFVNNLVCGAVVRLLPFLG
jgi:hypothetical protein